MSPKNKLNDAALLKKIDTAAQAVSKSETAVEEAQAERVAKCKALGLLLLEAKKRHPAVKDFAAFLKDAKHVKLAAAYDYMRLVGGRKTDEEIRKGEEDRRARQRSRQQKSRRSRLPKPEPEPEPEPEVSVTSPHVTESSEPVDEPVRETITLLPDGQVITSPKEPTETAEEDSAEATAKKRMAENADLGLSREEKVAKVSTKNLAEFEIAARLYLPKVTIETDRQKARLLVSELTSTQPRLKAKAA